MKIIFKLTFINDFLKKKKKKWFWCCLCWKNNYRQYNLFLFSIINRIFSNLQTTPQAHL